MSIVINPLSDGSVKLTNGDTGQDLLTFDDQGNATFFGRIYYPEEYAGLTQDLVGSIQVFIMGTKPVGRYIKANGALLNRAVYADLFEKIGTQWGVGDGSTTFGIPDLRGEFLRFWDDGRGVDTDREFGSLQLDQMQRITGSAYTFTGGGGSSTGALNKAYSHRQGGGGGSARNAYNINLDSLNSPNARVSDDTSGETRPRNIALQAWIRY